jgi:hypothetical protein
MSTWRARVSASTARGTAPGASASAVISSEVCMLTLRLAVERHNAKSQRLILVGIARDIGELGVVHGPVPATNVGSEVPRGERTGTCPGPSRANSHALVLAGSGLFRPEVLPVAGIECVPNAAQVARNRNLRLRDSCRAGGPRAGRAAGHTHGEDCPDCKPRDESTAHGTILSAATHTNHTVSQPQMSSAENRALDKQMKVGRSTRTPN